jgi:riboflavin kinase/FMN adenylyltransferase
LTSIEERIRLLEAAGMEQLLILPFTREVAGLSPAEFADRVLARLGPRAIVVGDNFRFGHKQLGDTRVLGELGETRGFRVEALEAVRLRGRVVSSTEVRVLVSTGDVARAARLLQRWFSLEGRVVTGRGVGAKQTVPTLNLATDAEVLPAHGVYVTRTRDLDDGREWASITNVGVRPTFGVEGLSVETFLLDPFDGVTPARIRVSFCHYIREERKFESPEALRSQILRDVARAQAWFRRRTRFRQLLREGAVR